MEPPTPECVGLKFVRKYYTLLKQEPLHLHRFYNEQSSFVHGGVDSGTDAEVVRGQQEIRQKILQLNFKDCHVKIRKVDSHKTLADGVVVQISGELSNNGKPMRRFVRTVVLAPQSAKKYFIHNDIFRYQDEDISDYQNETTARKTTDEVRFEEPIQNQIIAAASKPVVLVVPAAPQLHQPVIREPDVKQETQTSSINQISATQSSSNNNNSVNVLCQDPVNENVMEKVRSGIRITKLGSRSKSVLPQVKIVSKPDPPTDGCDFQPKEEKESIKKRNEDEVRKREKIKVNVSEGNKERKHGIRIRKLGTIKKKTVVKEILDITKELKEDGTDSMRKRSMSSPHKHYTSSSSRSSIISSKSAKISKPSSDKEVNVLRHPGKFDSPKVSKHTASTLKPTLLTPKSTTSTSETTPPTSKHTFLTTDNTTAMSRPTTLTLKPAPTTETTPEPTPLTLIPTTSTESSTKTPRPTYSATKLIPKRSKTTDIFKRASPVSNTSNSTPKPNPPGSNTSNSTHPTAKTITSIPNPITPKPNSPVSGSSTLTPKHRNLTPNPSSSTHKPVKPIYKTATSRIRIRKEKIKPCFVKLGKMKPESEIKKLIKSKVTKVEKETPNISEKKVDSKKEIKPISVVPIKSEKKKRRNEDKVEDGVTRKKVSNTTKKKFKFGVLPSSKVHSYSFSNITLPTSQTCSFFNINLPTSQTYPYSDPVLRTSTTFRRSNPVLSTSPTYLFSDPVLSTFQPQPYSDPVLSTTPTYHRSNPVLPTSTTYPYSNSVLPTSQNYLYSKPVLATSPNCPYSEPVLPTSPTYPYSDSVLPTSQNYLYSKPVLATSPTCPYSEPVLPNSPTYPYSEPVHPSSPTYPHSEPVLSTSPTFSYTEPVLPFSPTYPYSEPVLPTSQPYPYSESVLPTSPTYPFSEPCSFSSPIQSYSESILQPYPASIASIKSLSAPVLQRSAQILSAYPGVTPAVHALPSIVTQPSPLRSKNVKKKIEKKL